MDTPRRDRIISFLLAVLLVLLAAWAFAIAHLGAACPGEGSFSCLTLVRPSLRSLGPFPLGFVVTAGALVQALCALLLLLRDPGTSFVRDVSLLSAAGAGFALGLQPLALLASRTLCLVCLLTLATELLLALSLGLSARRKGASLRPALGSFLLVLVVTAFFSAQKGVETARRDESHRAQLAKLERKGARLVLLERPGCPFCEALLLDFLGTPEVLSRLEKTGLERVPSPPGEPAPVLLARDREGKEIVRVLGFSSDPSAYEAVLEAARR